MKKIVILCIFVFISTLLLAVIEETESLKGFLYGEAPGCEYDNWMSHIAEGLASPGYNSYAPWDRQLDGFGNYEIPQGDTLVFWGRIVDEFLSGQLDAAQDSIDAHSFPYQVVIFNDTDSGRTFHMLREIPNMEYYDNNDTPDFNDDEFGAFDYAWGLYIYNLEGTNPHITTAVHPCDDYVIVPLAHKVFIDHDSKFLLISGTGREVTWTNIGNYSNSKSTCDPSRVEDHVFNVCYQKFCDLIRFEFFANEFSVQVHSFDWGESHKGYADVQISGGHSAGSPDLPIRDHSSLKLDVPNLSGEYVLPANSVGMHDAVHLNDYYAFHCNEYEFNYVNTDTTFAINTHMDLPGYSSNRQMVYTNSGMSQYDNFERFFHIEVDELPNTFPLTVANYNWFNGWNPVTLTWDMDHKFDNTLAWYSPWIDALGTALEALYEMDDGEVPIAPSNLEVISETSTKIKIKWEIGDCYDMGSYEILYSTEPIASGVYSIRDKSNYAKLACLAQDNFTFTGLEPGDEFYFAVRILDKNGNYSELSNEVFGSTGIAEIGNFIAYGRDEKINLTWKATCDTTFSGFNLYRKTDETEFELIESWQTNEALVGVSGTNVDYEYVDIGTENDLIYTYKLGSEDEGIEHLYEIEPRAISRNIFKLAATSVSFFLSDTCYFGFNEFASNGYDVNYDTPADTSTAGDYLNSEFYESNWENVPNQLEQEIYSAYDPVHSRKVWTYRFKTNMLNSPVEIGLVDLERDAERIYLYRGGVYIDLTQDIFTFIPTAESYYSFDLYYGNWEPSVTFAGIPNQLLYPYETVSIDWDVNLQPTIQAVNVYAVNEEITIPIAMDLPATTTQTEWIVPQLLFEDLRCKIDLVMWEGDTLSYYSPYKFGIITPQSVVQTNEGWNLITRNFDTDLYNTNEIYGENSEFFIFLQEEFFAVNEPEFLQPYWIYAEEDNYIELNNVTLQRSASSSILSAGWNLLPNPHRASYDIEQLVFSINNQDFEYYQAVQNHFIEPVIFGYDDMFEISGDLTDSNAYYIYSYVDDLIVIFIPYYDNEYNPEFEFEWKATVKCEIEGSKKSSLVVGTSAMADTLYNVNLDILKPVHTPFVDPVSIYLPLEVNGSNEKMHRSIINDELPLNEVVYRWNAVLAVTDSLPVIFSANDMELPEDLEIGLEFPDAYFNLSLSEEVEYIPSDSLISFDVIVSSELADTDDEMIIPASYALGNYPNPFNPATTIRFDLPQEGKVKLAIYNIRGQKVKQLVHDLVAAGSHQIKWNGKDEGNKQVASGVYFYRLEVAGKKTLTNKMLMLK